MRVDFSDEAILKLEEIHARIKIYQSEDFADAVIDRIFDKTQLLLDFPAMGAIERNKVFGDSKTRYLLEGYYKILYQINLNQGIIEVISVFDTRQDPSKMLSKEE